MPISTTIKLPATISDQQEHLPKPNRTKTMIYSTKKPAQRVATRSSIIKTDLLLDLPASRIAAKVVRNCDILYGNTLSDVLLQLGLFLKRLPCVPEVTVRGIQAKVHNKWIHISDQESYESVLGQLLQSTHIKCKVVAAVVDDPPYLQQRKPPILPKSKRRNVVRSTKVLIDLPNGATSRKSVQQYNILYDRYFSDITERLNHLVQRSPDSPTVDIHSLRFFAGGTWTTVSNQEQYHAIRQKLLDCDRIKCKIVSATVANPPSN